MKRRMRLWDFRKATARGLSRVMATFESWPQYGPIPGLPVNTVAPAITGTATVGSTLTVSSGTWSNTPSYTYQWRRNGVDIALATASTYLLVAADGGKTVTAIVTATKAPWHASTLSNSVSVT